MTVLRAASNLATPQARIKRPTIVGLSAHCLSVSRQANYVTNVSTTCRHPVTNATQYGRGSPSALPARNGRTARSPSCPADQPPFLVTVDALQYEIGRIAESPSEHDPAAAFFEQQHGAVCRSRGPAAGDHRQYQREQHHADTVIEQRFAGDDDLQTLRRAGDFNMPITAIGSVSVINAPKIRQYESGSAILRYGRIARRPKPTSRVDASCRFAICTLSARSNRHAMRRQTAQRQQALQQKLGKID